MKVCVTGMGALSSLGNSVDSLWQGLIENRSGVRGYPEWRQYRGLHSFLGAPVPPYDEKQIPRSSRRSMSRMSEMAVLATKQALEQAKLSLESYNPRVLVLFGSTTGSPDTLEQYFRKLFDNGGPEGQLSTSFFKVMNHSVAANVALSLGFSGALLSPSSACSTSSQAVVLGWELIQSGLYDVVIAGGADELHYISTAVFDVVMAASRRYNDTPEESPRPFDRDRDGLVVSEGAAVVVLESEQHVRRREGRVLAEVLGGAYLTDGIHMSQPQAESMERAMRIALERSGVKPTEIDYINAHATGTVLGDAEESKSVFRVFGDKVPFSSLKGHFGHSLAACGTLEVIASIQMMHKKLLVPTRNLKHIAPDCEGPCHLRELTEGTLAKVLSNNFAFGGMNVSLVISLPN